MPHHNFEELEIWKRSSRLAVEIIKLAEEIKLYALRDQLTRSAISVPSNIAEGAERNSNKEFIRFLNIALGSCAELRTQLYIANKAQILSKESTNPTIQETKELSAMIHAFIQKLSGLDSGV